MEGNYFKELYSIDVNDRTYQKKDLTYLSWCSAWSELKKLHPNATYDFKKFKDVKQTTKREYSENGEVISETISTVEQLIPYIETDLGITVYTEVTVDGITHEMELTVMDGANKAMKSQPYTYATKYGDKTVEAATMFDINKAIMRCLTKNIAMHGIGLYIYEKDSLPSSIVEIQNLQKICLDLMNKKAALSEKAKEKVAEVSKKADENANGDPRLIDDIEILELLKKSLMAIRK